MLFYCNEDISRLRFSKVREGLERVARPYRYEKDVDDERDTDRLCVVDGRTARSPSACIAYSTKILVNKVYKKNKLYL